MHQQKYADTVGYFLQGCGWILSERIPNRPTAESSMTIVRFSGCLVDYSVFFTSECVVDTVGIGVCDQSVSWESGECILVIPSADPQVACHTMRAVTFRRSLGRTSCACGFDSNPI